jgi:hypothetical protein
LEAAIEEVLLEKGLGDKWWYGRKKAQNAQKSNCRDGKFNVLQWTKPEIPTRYNSIIDKNG